MVCPVFPSRSMTTSAPPRCLFRVVAFLLAAVRFSGVAAAEPSRLINLSARGLAGTESDPLIAGFVVSGNIGKTLLIRGVGPTLTSLGVANAVADPVLSVYGSNGLI